MLRPHGTLAWSVRRCEPPWAEIASARACIQLELELGSRSAAAVAVGGSKSNFMIVDVFRFVAIEPEDTPPLRRNCDGSVNAS